PVVNENDAIADDEIRFGDNDRLAALTAHLVRADVLVLLTDAPGLLTADPRLDSEASLIQEVVEVDRELERMAGGAGSERGSGAAGEAGAWATGRRPRRRRRAARAGRRRAARPSPATQRAMSIWRSRIAGRRCAPRRASRSTSSRRPCRAAISRRRSWRSTA